MIEEQEYKPAYITIVEGPPPDFRNAFDQWIFGIVDGAGKNQFSKCEMRTFDGPKLVKRCQDAWREGRSIRLDFPSDFDGRRKELDIVAARWQSMQEGHKLHLWVKK